MAGTIELTEREQVIAGLREFADFLEAHPIVEATQQHFLVYVMSRETMADIARIGGWRKTYNDYFNLSREFRSGATLQVYCDRGLVCRRVVTGQRVVPAQPATEERIEDVVEWVCDDASLLGSGAARTEPKEEQ